MVMRHGDLTSRLEVIFDLVSQANESLASHIKRQGITVRVTLKVK